MNDKPNAAPPAPKGEAAPAAAEQPKASPSADRDASHLEEGDEQPKIEQKAPKKLSADELVTKHLGEVATLKPEDHPEAHRLVSELIEEAELTRTQTRALLARFFAHGLQMRSRIHPEVFKAALEEALHGRV